MIAKASSFTTRNKTVVIGSILAALAVGTTSFALKNKNTTTRAASTVLTKRSIMATSMAHNLPSGGAAPASLSDKEAQNGKIWNRFADGYSKSPIKDEESYQKKLEITRKYFTPTTKVLEFGCGTGGTAILHAPYVQHIHAIDLSSRMIEIAQEKQQAAGISNVDFECTGIDSHQVTKNEYDVVMGMSILHLLPNKDEIIKKVHSNLKPGGYFVSSTVCIGDFAKFLGWIAPVGNWLGFLPPLNIFKKEELRKSMEDSGFEITEEFHPAKDKAVFFVARKL